MVYMVVVADMQAYLVPDLVGEVPLQWFGPGDGRLAKVQFRSGLDDQCQDLVFGVDFGSDGPLE